VLRPHEHSIAVAQARARPTGATNRIGRAGKRVDVVPDHGVERARRVDSTK
jgi:hypothetical protein